MSLLDRMLGRDKTHESKAVKSKADRRREREMEETRRRQQALQMEVEVLSRRAYE